MLKGKKIILGITGSIAAYKSASLVRILLKEGAEVQVVMTRSATDFITPLTLSTLSKRPVLTESFHPGSGEWYSHVDWANWADLVLIAPATANTLAKMARGQADNLLVAICLAARCPVFFAPAMDVDMFLHPATQQNIVILQSYGNLLIPPGEGELASGLTGQGRLMEPPDIAAFLNAFLKKKSPFAGKKVMISAGPTCENLDPVRYISNYSSGKMGFALAEAFAGLGAAVTLISGPVNLHVSHPGILRIDVVSAAQMDKACRKAFADCDIAIMAAAVSDFTPGRPGKEKIKKKGGPLLLELKPTPDILAGLGKIKKKQQFLAGFALETRNEIKNAEEKLKNKNLDLIVLNSMKDPGAGFGHDTNKVTILAPGKSPLALPLMSKKEAAEAIADFIRHSLQHPHE